VIKNNLTVKIPLNEFYFGSGDPACAPAETHGDSSLHLHRPYFSSHYHYYKHTSVLCIEHNAVAPQCGISLTFASRQREHSRLLFGLSLSLSLSLSLVLLLPISPPMASSKFYIRESTFVADSPCKSAAVIIVMHFREMHLIRTCFLLLCRIIDAVV